MRMRKLIKRASAFLFVLFMAIGVFSPLEAKAGELPYVVDNASLLSADEAAKLEAKLSEYSAKHKLDIVVITTDDASLTNAEAAADDLFDYSGYGQGSNRDGVLFFINMSTRKWHISTSGYGITAFTDYGISYIGDKVTPYISDENYYEGFDYFADLCDEFVTQAKNGKPFDSNNQPKEPYPVLRFIIYALGLGIVVALIYVLILRSQLKSVAPKDSAADYVKPGSMIVNDGGSFYLYSNVSRVAKQTSSGGGSSTHSSSSGRTHGGGGGSF